MAYNAGPQTSLEAGARHERTLEAVRCKPSFGAGMGRNSEGPSWLYGSAARPRLGMSQHQSCPGEDNRLYPRLHAWLGYQLSRRIRLKLCAVGPLGGWVARKSASGTTSSGVFAHSLSIANTPSRCPLVTTGPGISSFTLIFAGASSWASTRVSIHNPALKHA